MEKQTVFHDIFDTAARGSVDDLRVILEEKKKKITAKDACWGKTMLQHAAAWNPDVEVLKYLLAQGAKINTKVGCGGETPLHCAAQNNSNLDVVRFLIEQGADINAKNGWGRTPLHNSADWNSVEVLSYLIEKGADVNAQADDERTPLDCVRRFAEKKRAVLIAAGGKSWKDLPLRSFVPTSQK